MKRISTAFVASTLALLLSACAGGARIAAPDSPNSERATADSSVAAGAAGRARRANQLSVDDGSGNMILLQKVEFQSGVSSITVEKLAKRYGCEGGSGAGRITGKGPLEMYRMNCDNGRAFLAKCELRQCRPAH